MKNGTSLYLFFFVLFSFSVEAQILNAGFENWDMNGNPVSWQAANAPPVYTTITKTSDKHSGNWAAQGDVAPFSVFTVGPSLYSGEQAQGIPINFRPGSVKGFYKFTSVQGDFLQVQVNLRKNGVYIGGGANNLSPIGSYAQFSIDIGYISPDIPDTALIAIFISYTTGFPHVGSKMFIDDLSWGTTTDIYENEIQTPNEFKLLQNYPNPFNPSTRIQYQISSGTHVSLKVYDILGNEVTTLVNEYKSTGKYQIEFNAASLSTGTYFYILRTDSFIETKKMILMR